MGTRLQARQFGKNRQIVIEMPFKNILIAIRLQERASVTELQHPAIDPGYLRPNAIKIGSSRNESHAFILLPKESNS
jgi:hypothetical protein